MYAVKYVTLTGIYVGHDPDRLGLTLIIPVAVTTQEFMFQTS